MKRAIVICYDFPPCQAPGAALRTAKLVEHLPRLDWEAQIVCRKESIPYAADEDASRLLRIPIPVPPQASYQAGAWMWAARIAPRLRTLISDRKPDVIYASGPPYPHTCTAAKLGREAGIPVVVDFRDAWSLDPHLTGGALQQRAKEVLCRYVYPPLERFVVDNAAAVLFNTPSTREAYLRLFPNAESRFHLVPNGFDEADFEESVELPVRQRPLFLYCGRFSGVGARSPELLLQGVRGAIDRGLKFDLDILGDDSPTLQAYIDRIGLTPYVQARRSVAHRQAIRAMRAADVLVVYQKPSRNGVTPIAGKTFEYLRAGRPILAIVPPGDNADVVSRYAPVHRLVHTEDPLEVTNGIVDLINRSRYAAQARPDPQLSARYGRAAIAAQIADIMERVSGGVRLRHAEHVY